MESSTLLQAEVIISPFQVSIQCLPASPSAHITLNHTSFARAHISLWLIYTQLIHMNCTTAVCYDHAHLTLCIFACFVSTRVVVLTLTARKTSCQEPRRRPATKTHWHWHRLNNLFQITPYTCIFILCMIFFMCMCRNVFLLYIYALKKEKTSPKVLPSHEKLTFAFITNMLMFSSNNFF